MPSITMTRGAGGGGLSMSRQKTLTGDSLLNCSKSLSAAKTGTLTTRTDANTGTITAQSSHGITTGDKVCIFWDGGLRYDVTVGTVSGNSVPIDLGGGDNLPVATTTLTIMVQNAETNGWTFDGDDVVGFACGASVPFVVLFKEGSTVTAAYYSADSDGDAHFYDSEETSTVAANPLAGAAIDSIAFAHGSSAAAKTVSVLALLN